MSTKTSIKRIALVAVSALGFGLLSFAPSQANEWDKTATASTSSIDYLDCLAGYTATEALGCSAIVGDRVKIGGVQLINGEAVGDDDTDESGTVDASDAAGRDLATSTTYYVQFTGGKIESITSGADADVAWAAITNITDTLTVTTSATDADNDGAAGEDFAWISKASAGAGDVTVSLYYYDANGVKVVLETHTITFISAGDQAVDFASNSTFVGLVADGANCRAGTETYQSVYTTGNFEAGDTTTGLDLCMVLYDKNGDALDATENDNVEVDITGDGNLNIGADGSNYSFDYSAVDTDDDGDGVVSIVADSDVDSPADGGKGATSTVSVKVTHTNSSKSISATKTWTFTINQYGVIATVTNLQLVYSKDDDAAAGAVAYLYALDAGGRYVPHTFATTDFVVDSDSSSVQTIDAQGENDSTSTWALSTAATTFSPINKYNPAVVTLAGADGKYETNKFKVITENAAEEDVTSNEITIHISNNLVSTLTIASSATSAALGEAVTVTVTAKDATGRPVADAETISFAAINGAVTPATANTENGVASTTFIAGGPGASGSVIATAESGIYLKTATSNVSITGATTSSAADAAADAAAEAIDAANAATDAANLAAEAADAATVAAEEARDAADAATAAVEELATQVATLMAALKAQITTLANTVAKIAKKVKA